jgi:hypothetical protein
MDDGLYLEAQYGVEFSENGTAHFGDVYDGSFGDFNGEFQAPTSEFQVLAYPRDSGSGISLSRISAVLTYK